MEWFDQIVLLDRGRVLAVGKHEEVLKQPIYRRLVERQQLMKALES